MSEPLLDESRPVAEVVTGGGAEPTSAGSVGDDSDSRSQPTAAPLVAVVGRPNVGKSSLVNRFIGRRATVVQKDPGVTRDRKVLDTEWAGRPLRVVDTGGWMAGGDALEAKVSRQAEQALERADLIVFVVDVAQGVTGEDEAAARLVRRSPVPTILVVNKVDDASWEPGAWEFMRLGLGDPWAVSALHGRGTGDLLDEVVRSLPGPRESPEEVRPDEQSENVAGFERAAEEGSPRGAAGTLEVASGLPSVAIVGRPNAGKSTLFNRLVGEERSIVHDLPGTTRDVIDTVLETPEGSVRFLDTAGMRRPARTSRGTESYAVLRALEALDRADVALLVIDATVGPSHQDQRLAERIGAAGCPAVVVLNKWDTLDPDGRERVLAGLADRLLFLGDAPVLRVSARKGRGVHRIVPAIRTVLEGYRSRVTTGMLNRALRELQSAHPAPGARIRYGVQGAAEPPTFTLFSSGRLPPTYLRYIERGLRERFDFGSTPLKLRVRTTGRRA